MPSKIPGAFSAVVSMFRAGLPNLTVIAGPGATDMADTSYVLVGVADPDESTYADAVTGSQQWAQLGGKFRDEHFSIHCVAVAWNGDSDSVKALTDVFAIVDAAGNALVADPTLGGALLYAVGLTSIRVRLGQDANGAYAHLPFDVECRTRI